MSFYRDGGYAIIKCCKNKTEDCKSEMTVNDFCVERDKVSITKINVKIF